MTGASWPGATVDVIIKDSDDARGVFRFNDATLRQNVHELFDGGLTNQITFKVVGWIDDCIDDYMDG